MKVPLGLSASAGGRWPQDIVENAICAPGGGLHGAQKKNTGSWGSPGPRGVRYFAK